MIIARVLVSGIYADTIERSAIVGDKGNFLMTSGDGLSDVSFLRGASRALVFQALGTSKVDHEANAAFRTA